jgi:hypothetical protein
LFWIIGCVCALVFGREGTAEELDQRLYGVRAQPAYGVLKSQPALTAEQQTATEKLIDKYTTVAEAERGPIVDELKKLAGSGLIVQQKEREAYRVAVLAKHSVKEAESAGKTEEAAKLRADAEKAAAKSEALAKLLALFPAGALKPPEPTTDPRTLISEYGVRAREEPKKLK